MGNFDGSSATRGAADGTRVVSCDLTFVISEPAEVVLQVVAASSAGRLLDERFEVTSDVEPPLVAEVAGPHGSRLHLVRARSRTARGGIPLRDRPESSRSPAASAGNAGTSFERQVYLRPSRYCPSDHLVGFAVSEFGTGGDGAIARRSDRRVDSPAHWLRARFEQRARLRRRHPPYRHGHLPGLRPPRYRALPGDGDTGSFRRCVRAGLSPMDFHAVFEASCDDRWSVHDAARLAPRPSLVRIATGRDAADTAFADITSGGADLETIDVSATVSSTSLPEDDGRAMAHLD